MMAIVSHTRPPCTLLPTWHLRNSSLVCMKPAPTRHHPKPSHPICETFIINGQMFTCLVVNALSQLFLVQMEAWTSKDATRLVHDLREHDFVGCFIRRS